MDVVDEAVEDGIGIGRVADHLVQFVDRDLAGQDGRAAFFEDLVEIAAGGGSMTRTPTSCSNGRQELLPKAVAAVVESGAMLWCRSRSDRPRRRRADRQGWKPGIEIVLQLV